jgi:serine acetyltransferase
LDWFKPYFLKNVEVSNYVIIGAGCVIYKSIPDNAVITNKQQLENIN